MSSNNLGTAHNSANMSAYPEMHCMNLFDLSGQVAVLTGASSSMGSMIARSLVANGCKVYLVSRRAENLQRVCQELESSAHGRLPSEGQIIPIQMDLSTKDGAEKLKKELESREKCIDLLVCLSYSTSSLYHSDHCAAPSLGRIKLTILLSFVWSRKINAAKYKGTMADVGPGAGHNLKSIFEALWEQKQQEAENVVRTDIVGLYFTIVGLLPLLGRSSHHPQIITVAGVSGLVNEPMGGLIEPATKAAVIHLTKMFGTLLAKTNIRCNVIAPGPCECVVCLVSSLNPPWSFEFIY